jgi:hypothetical protein
LLFPAGFLRGMLDGNYQAIRTQRFLARCLKSMRLLKIIYRFLIRRFSRRKEELQVIAFDFYPENACFQQ